MKHRLRARARAVYGLLILATVLSWIVTLAVPFIAYWVGAVAAGGWAIVLLLMYGDPTTKLDDQ